MPHKKIHVIQTPVRFYPYIGGVENHVYYLGKELVKKGYDINVICSNESPRQTKHIEGMRVKRLQYITKVTNTNITLFLPYILLKTSFDIIHTHMPTPWTCDWSIIIAKLKKKKSVLTIHNDMQKGGIFAKLLTDFYLNTVFRISLAWVDHIIIVNPDWKDSFIYTKRLLLPYISKISIASNGVDTEAFKSHKKKLENTILFVSILDKHHLFKGLDYLLDAFKILYQKNNSLQLTIIGEGSLKPMYEGKVKDMNMQENIHFLGEKSQAELVNYFSESTVFVLPSINTEGFGIVLLEALSCKTPVVTTSIAGVATEIKENKCGFVVQPKDSVSLAQAIHKILTNYDLRREMGANARHLIEQKYSWNKIAQAVDTIYQHLVI